MKKFTTRAMALGMSVSLLMAGCMTAYADTETANSETTGTTTTNSTFTITAPENSTHTYWIYQIFTGDYANGILSNIAWGQNGINNGEAVEAGKAVPQTVLDALTALNEGNKTDTEKLEVIEKYADLTGSPVGEITSDKTTCTVAPGYYLIKDKDGSVSGNDAYTTYIVKVVGNVNIEPKSDVPSFDKKLKDKNDSTGDTSDWQDSADYDIGDKIPFKLEGTVASNYASYSHYYFAFHDKEETGLTFDPTSVKVYVVNEVEGNEEETEITAGENTFTLVTAAGEMSEAETNEKCTFEIVFNDLKKIDSVKAGSKIRVEYESTLNEEAVLGNQGNVNKGKLEFSNNPNSDQEGKPDKPGETPWDNVIVFTYQVVVNKYANSVDAANKLTGAEFTLKKKLPKENEDDEEKTETIKVIKSGDGTSFTFKGLDDGEYILSETKTPDGYNTIADITFTVRAEHDIIWTTQSREDVLTSLTGDDGKADGATGKITFTTDDDKSDLITNVINKSGITLPGTGGVGTTMFYVIGGVLMAGAGILLVTRKRMEESEK